MDKELAEIAIGAFLHDIGKISQRGKGVLSSQSENMKSFICPVGKHGGHTHLHTAYTNDFFEGIDGFLPKGLDKSNVANLASYHHRPDTPEQTIIQQADWLSAGQDRRKAEEEDTPRYMRARLNSVFSSIRMCSEPGTSQPKLFSILPQSLDQEAFRRLIDRTSFSMAQQDVRYFLNGLLLEVTEEHVRAVATDGHRLAMCTLTPDEGTLGGAGTGARRGGGGRHAPDRRAQHAQRASAGRRGAFGQADPAEARIRRNGRGMAPRRRVHPSGRQREGHPLRARDTDLRAFDEEHA